MRIKLAYKKITACELYRIILPADNMPHHDFVHDDKHRIQFKNNEPHDIIGDLNFDLVVFPRPTHKWIPKIIDILHDKGVATVCEIDDDLQSISRQHKAWRYFQPQFNEDHNWKNAAKSCAAADMVVVTTDALAERYGKHGRVRVIPNYIPDHFIDMGKKKEFGKKIGWGGMMASHPNDLKAMGPAIHRITAEPGVVFHHLGEGDAAGEVKAQKYHVEPPCSLKEWPQKLLEFDIGVAPLEMSQFNEAKSYLKPLEYMSLGIPWVGSPSGPYKGLASLGAGTIAKNARQWYTALKRLTSDPLFWQEEHDKGLEIASELTISKHWMKWDEAWNKAAGRIQGW